MNEFIEREHSLHERRGGIVGGGFPSGHIFHRITDPENIFLAWREFRQGKRLKTEVQEFEFNLEQHLFQIHQELVFKKYRHSGYESFYVSDPKLRHIHKARVRDRVVHHALTRIISPIVDRQFIYDSYACRVGKGTHRAVQRLEEFLRKSGSNNRRTAYVLKCDIRKFFDSIPHNRLLEIIKQSVDDPDTIWLINNILESFSKIPHQGLPLGNLTSQLFGNVYLNQFDQWIKHQLRAKQYIRYCDDFIVAHHDQEYLKNLVPQMHKFLYDILGLEIHTNKISIRTYRQGIDFLGYILLPYHRVLRTRTRRRMIRRLANNSNPQAVQSYLGILSHANSFSLRSSLHRFL